MYLLIIILPLLASIILGFFGRKIGVKGAQIISCSLIITTTLLAIIAFFEVGYNNIPLELIIFRWLDLESVYVLWGFFFDSLTVGMLIPVLIVSSLVHLYSIGYMSHDPHIQRFFCYLSLFTFMMIILVTADNYLVMFLGWEGVGVCSYLLVNFWFTRIAANQSSISAFLTNRVGDCFLTLGMFMIIWSFGNIDYSTVFSLAPFINQNIVTLIGICLLIGAMAKSSQVGLHVWLPMAMEGPTPVSALIHAATMVTAGVYLLMRSSPLIEYSSTVLLLCLWLGAITTIFSSLIGLFQQDIKKVIAYSTMSQLAQKYIYIQLGMMVIAIGLSSYNLALFHLVNHAFYKALLFLGAGAVIHSVGDNQDFRKYGGLKVFLPLVYSVMLIASFSLVAIPFMTGFYSKDFILESAFGQYYLSSTIVYFIATIGAMFTTLYSVKVLYLTFLTNPNGPLNSYKHVDQGNIFINLPLIILAIFSIFFGYLTKDLFIGLGTGFYSDNSIFIHPNHEIMLDTEFAVPTLFKLLPFFFTISLSLFAFILSEFFGNLLIKFKFTRFGYNIFSFLNQRFLIEFFYNKYITDFILKLGGITTKVLDKGSVELLGPYGLEKFLLSLSINISNISTGVITSYALYILVGLIFYICLLFFNYFDSNFLFLILFAIFFTINNNNNK
uniref:NADH dehydrogenase subunit 5 n=1 Tax=Ophidiomyces ophidiicola TaxID=1387563 RepID=UPI0028CFEC88|nr:NADH dehydrogenase subunit 5 [Ophidiomyces ophidiicola]WML69497.1 NADH dehydrogenase subunit 5 [Ophidiomyces ophidiicola]